MESWVEQNKPHQQRVAGVISCAFLCGRPPPESAAVGMMAAREAGVPLDFGDGGETALEVLDVKGAETFFSRALVCGDAREGERRWRVCNGAMTDRLGSACAFARDSHRQRPKRRHAVHPRRLLWRAMHVYLVWCILVSCLLRTRTEAGAREGSRVHAHPPPPNTRRP